MSMPLVPPETPTPPAPRRGRASLGTPQLAAGLAVILVVLVVIAVVPGLKLPRIVLDWETATPTPSAPPTVAPSPSVSLAPSFVRPTPTALPTFMSYTVRPGDSLNSIATQFNTKARSIAWWNRGSYPNLDPESPTYNPGLIEIGWVLVLIPGVVVDEEHPPSPSPGRATPSLTASPPPAGDEPAETSPLPS